MDKQLDNVAQDNVWCSLLIVHSKGSSFGSDLKPLRIPLHAKLSKRCHVCRHILIKPEQKAQSVRYKIKLMAANYLPALKVTLPHLQKAIEPPKRVGQKDDPKGALEEGITAGKTYPFHLALTNPLYDPIQVRLSVQRVHVSATDATGEKSRRPPFAISLPTAAFGIAPFAEAWEYEDEEEMFDADDIDLENIGHNRVPREKEQRPKTKTVGILEKKANTTVVGGEIVIGREAKGSLKVE
jgi:dynactin-4